MKSFGYLISIVSVLLLGTVAWPRPGDPPWKAVVVMAGMAASILGMFLRYVSHRHEKAELERVEVQLSVQPKDIHHVQ